MTHVPFGESDVRLRHAEAAIARLSARVEALELAQRLAAVVPPQAAEPPETIIAAEPQAIAHAEASETPEPAPNWLGLAGRTFIVLGGAFLLRALTNSGQLPMASGVLMGLAYAALWLALAGRASGANALFHGVSALLVGLPIVIEAVFSFRVMPGDVASATLTAIAMAALVIAWYRHLRAFALIATLGTIAATFVLVVGLSQMPAPATVLSPVLALLVIGQTTLWVSYGRRWSWLPWPAAAAANLGAVILTVRASAAPARDAPFPAQLLLGLLIAGYLGSFIIRILLHDREVRVFEILQTAAVLLIGLGGATMIAAANGIGVSGPALGALFAGGLLYVQAFTRVAPRRGSGAEFYYLGMTAQALVLVGVSLLIPYPGRPMVIAAGALAGSLIGWRRSHPLLALQGAIAAVVASAQSGLVTFTAIVWLTHPQPWPAVAAPIWAVLGAVLAALLVPRALREDAPPVLAYAARVALSVAFIAGLGSVVVTGAGHLMGDLSADAGMVATVKTIILAGAAAALAWAGRSQRFVEFGWLAYGALAAGGLKILFEDFPASRPSTLFLALAAYGAALILVPRLSRAHTIATP